MNAIELADELEDLGKFFEDRLYTKSAAMLRQQQAEIDEWKYVIERLNSVIRQKEAEIEALKSRELTDEEIREVINTLDADFGLDDFAKAILRKASEK